MLPNPRRKSDSTNLPKKANLRFVTRTKWELPMQKRKTYWDQVFNGIEKGHLKVNQPLFSFLPPDPFNFPLESSPGGNDKVSRDSPEDHARQLIDMKEPIVRISPPSPSHNDRDRLEPYDKSFETESIELLKARDVSNFDLDFKKAKLQPTDEQSRENVALQDEESKPKLLTLSAIGKISHLSKISKYVNDFLASTKVKVKSSVSPKNYVHPLHEAAAEASHRARPVAEEKTPDSEKRMLAELVSSPSAIQSVAVEQASTPEVQQKHVAFEDAEEHIDSTAERYYGKISRPRAPSLGVASAVPSFGKMISSLEYPDSVESRSSIETPSDDVNIANASPASNDSLKIPQGKRTPDVRLRMFLESPLANNFGKADVQHEKPKLFEVMPTTNDTEADKCQRWPRLTIVKTIRAFKALKMEPKPNTSSQQKSLTSPRSVKKSPTEKSSSSSIEQDGKRRSLESIGAMLDDGASGSSKSSSALRITRRRKSKLSFSEPIIVITPTPLERVTYIEKTRYTVKDLPALGGMYQRRKRNKCLSCLYKWKPKLETMVKWTPDDADEVYHKSIIAEFDSLLTNKFTEVSKKAQSEDDSQTSDISSQSKSPELHRSVSKVSQLSELKSTATTPELKSHHLQKTFSQKSIKGELSTKSAISTLSLASDFSRTASDQEDSDQAGEEVAGMGEEIPGSGSKYRAPCHAPLNFKPCLDPLLALKGKKSRSIQSRVASLEKEIDGGEEGKSERDDSTMEAQAPAVQAAEEEKEGSQSPRPEDDDDTLKERSDQETEDAKSEIVSEAGTLPPESDQEDSLKSSVTPDKMMERRKAMTLAEKIYRKLNVVFRDGDHNPSESFRPSAPVMTREEIVEMTRDALSTNDSVKDVLNMLLEEYSQRLTSKIASNTQLVEPNLQKIEKITNRLLTLLIDSKLYLYPELTSSNIQFSSKQKPTCNSQQLRRFLPFKSYNLVAPILGMPEWQAKRWSALRGARNLKISFKPKKVTTIQEYQTATPVVKQSESVVDFDLEVHPPSPKESFLAPEVKDTQKLRGLSPYASFLSKPRRKAVIWRPLMEADLQGYDPESTLKNRAARKTEKICKDFCDWLYSLGGASTAIDEDILKDMFETDFSAEACKTLQVEVREMPVIPTAVASTRCCPDAGEVEVTRRQLIRDVRAEKRPPTNFAFGSTVPNNLRYTPPNNSVDTNWIQCASVPQDLESMSFVWKDITHLESVGGFTNWLKSESNVKLPKPLQKTRRTSATKRN